MEKSTLLVFFFIAMLLLPQGVSAGNDDNCTAVVHKHRHKWVGPTGERKITVDAAGGGDFLSVQDAVDSIPVNNTKRVVIKIKAGIYVEKVMVPATKPYITFHGEGMEKTVIQWHDRANDRGENGQQLRTYNTASVSVFSNYFIARNISFKNTAPAPKPGMEGGQAVAFRISGDKAYFYGCGFYGAQDTLCDDAGRHYFRDCFIEGSIDFIFGNGRSLYKDCELHSIADRFGSVAAHGRKSPCERTGFVFVNCRVTGKGRLYVGRALGQYSRIVFAYTYFDNVVTAGAWDDWDHAADKNKTVFFAVYQCWGPGAAAVEGAPWAKELDYLTARQFITKSFVNGWHWLSMDA